jgi:hypothetical protein
MILHLFEDCELLIPHSNIDSTLLGHVTGCTPSQLQVLMSLATAPNGPPVSWSSNNIGILSLHIASFGPENIKIWSEGMAGLKTDIMNRMSFNQLLACKSGQHIIQMNSNLMFFNLRFSVI